MHGSATPASAGDFSKKMEAYLRLEKKWPENLLRHSED
jgi:hypothetical protein